MVDNEEIERYRQGLRDERNANRSETNTNLVRHGAIADGASRSSIPSIGRTSEEVRPASRKAGGGDQRNVSAQRSVETESIGKRPGRRRLGSPKPGSTDTPEATREPGPTTFGSIERVDEPFYRPGPEEKKPEKKADGLVKKLVDRLPDTGEGVPFFGTPRGKTFSKKEAEDQFEAVKNAISDYGDYIDMYMQRVEPGLPPIWGNFSDKELDFVAKALLKKAQTDQRAAVFTRTLLDGQDYIGALVALVPRFVETLKFANRRIARRIQKGPMHANTN